MKICKLIPSIIVCVVLLSAPFGHMKTYGSDPHGGLICYCCSAAGQKCAMLSCSGCCGSHAGDVVDRWSPEMVLGSIHPIPLLHVAYRETEPPKTPETVYLEVPDKPPETV